MSYYFIIKSGDIYVKLERCMLGYGNRQEVRRHLIELHYAWASVYAPTESNNQVSIWPLINFFFSHLSYVSIPTKSYKMKSYWFSNDSLLPHIKELWYQIRAAFQILWKIIWLQIMAATLYHIIYPDVMCCRNLPNNKNMKILFLMLDFFKRNCQTGIVTAAIIPKYKP